MKHALLIAAWLLGAPALVSAATYLINPDGSGDFPTIQEGIWAAANGDTIELGDGTFRGNWNRLIDYIGLAITVRSRGGDPATCVIDIEGGPQEQRFAFVFHSEEGPDSRLEGVTITGGFDLGC